MKESEVRQHVTTPLVNPAFAQDAAVPAAPEDPNAPSIAVEGGAPVELGTTGAGCDSAVGWAVPVLRTAVST